MRNCENNLSKVKLDKYDCIFLDIFDTVLSRKVPGEYVKKLWADLVNKSCVQTDSSLDIYSIRAKIERELCRESELKGFDQEFHYSDMLDRVYGELNKQYSIKIKNGNFNKLAYNIEQQIEEDVLFVNDDVLEFLERASSEKIPSYCLSDMYLPKEILRYVFKSKGLDKHVKDIIVSSESLLTKRSGRLYSELHEYIKGGFSEALMVGDNKDVDYSNAIDSGLDAILVDREERFMTYGAFDETDSTAYCSKKLSSMAKSNRTNGAPFVNIAFALYSFIDKLASALLAEGATDVYFLAREGEFLKVLFDKYVEQKFGVTIKSHYLLASRKATFLPSLDSLDREDFGRLFRQYNDMSGREFLKNLNFSHDNIERVIDNFPARDVFDDKIQGFQDSVMFKILLQSDLFRSIYDEERNTQRKSLELYLKSIGVRPKEKNYIVDVGWKGTIQDNLMAATGHNFTGYYFGIDTGIFKVQNMDSKVPVVFAKYKTHETPNYLFHQAGKSIMEIVLGASHGSAEKYVAKNRSPEVVLSNNKKEQNLYTQKIRPLQVQIEEVFERISDLLTNRMYNLKKINKVFERIHFDLLFRPTKADVEFFSDLSHYENFGILTYANFKPDKSLTTKQKLRKTAKYYLRRGGFTLNDYWPIYTLRSEGLQLVLPTYIYIKYIRSKKRGVL